MTLLLAIDSACASCSAALLQDETLLASQFSEMGRGQSENLLPFTEAVLKEANKTMGDVDLLAVTTGPGAFTGIRICMSTARALALAISKPLIGVTTTEALFAAQKITDPEITHVYVLIETKRQDLYLQIFKTDGHAIDDVQAVLMTDIHMQIQDHLTQGKILFCGDGSQRYLDQLSVDHQELSSQIKEKIIFDTSASTQPDAQVVAQVAFNKFQIAGPKSFHNPPQPVYLRPPDAIPPKPKFIFHTAGHK